MSQLPLLEPETASPSSSGKTKSRNPAIKRCIDRYSDGFLARHGVRPLIAGAKYGALFGKMLGTWGEETVLRIVDSFLASNDPWIVSKGWTIEVLYSMANTFVLGYEKPDKNTAANADAVQKATQRRSNA